MFASFNYDGPTLPAMIAGLSVAVVVLIVLCCLRRVVLGILAGAASGAALAWCVFAHGKGDMVGLMQGFGAVLFGIVGAILGGLFGYIGKVYHRRNAGQEGSARNDTASHRGI